MTDTANAPQPSAPEHPDAVRARLDAWVGLWNGDLDRAGEVVTPDFQVHAAMLDGGDGSEVEGAVGLVGWIAGIRTAFPDLRFTVEVPPLVDGRYAAVRWTATGTYVGGFPGATAEPGTVVGFTGTDTLRSQGGRFAEYWLNSDTLAMVTRLGVR
ncbi:ester cyclase [Kitasatospora sp. NPDC094015]|uniref:ester cyclase n=1 Tax=Kitasatospora sp. NPDC094015 TaxID=3155205 RepID=UPI0033192135